MNSPAPVETPLVKDLDEHLSVHCQSHPDHLALCDSYQRLSWRELDDQLNIIASAFINRGLKPNSRIAILARNSVSYALLFLGGLRAGLCVTPLSTLASSQALAAMINDSGAPLLFVSEDYRDLIAPVADQLHAIDPNEIMTLDPEPLCYGQGSGKSHTAKAFIQRYTQDEQHIAPIKIQPDLDWGFNLIYSSGTTGTPKGILQNRRYRAIELNTLAELGFNSQSKGLVSTPLYSNTTLFFFMSILGNGGSIYMMEKFNTTEYLRICEEEAITHTVLVPVQYERLLKDPALSNTDLSRFQFKCSTSAPLHKPVKEEVLKRWPQGGLWEFYGMTEGGVNCCLAAHLRPDKLETVGQPAEGCDVRIIDEQGNELPEGQAGEVVGHCDRMMVGYENREEATKEASWYSSNGDRFHRSGDIGWFDDERFLHLLDRKKDMIISGGFNVYAIDLEKVLLEHPQVDDVAVIAAPSEQWGETPVAYIVSNDATIDVTALKEWANQQLGKAQRISEIRTIDELPRSPIGKILKRELRDNFEQSL